MSAIAISENAEKRREIAKAIANSHYRIDSALDAIYEIIVDGEATGADAAVRLLEIDRDAVQAGIVPVTVGSHVETEPYTVFPIVVVDISPEEFDKLRNGEILLPQGWIIGARLERP